MAGNVIGFVKSAQGVVDVRGADGKIRSLLVGDELREGDTVLTTGGGMLVISLAEGGQLTIEPGQVVAMTSELSADRFPGVDESQVASVDDIVQAVLAGKDLDKMLEATAAGPAGAAGTNEGHTFVQLLRVTESVGEVSSTTSAFEQPRNDFDRITPLVDEPVVNQPPVAVDDSGQTEEGKPVTISILDNDSDPELDPLTITDVHLIDGADGSIKLNDDNTLTFNPGSHFDYLGEGETTTVQVEYTISDGHGGTDTAIVTITITGTNDAPQVTIEDDSGAVVEDASDPLLTDSGTIAFDDVDLSDDHTVAVTPSDSNPLGGTLTAVVSDPATGAGPGEVTWTYTVPNADTQYLAVGQTVTETFTVTIDDGHGGTQTSTVTVTVTGTNDVPTISAADASGSVTEGAGETLSDNGTVTFDDVDLIDEHSTTVSAADGNTLGGTLTAVISDAATGAGNGTIDWTYELPASAAEYLGEGDTVTETFTITVDDGHGGTVSQDVTITITGTNDVPVVTNDAASVTEDESNPTLSTSGAVTITDVDQGESSFDTGSLTFTGRTNNGAGGGSSQLGTLTVNPDGTYTFDVANSAVQYLGEGDSIVQTFTVGSSDGTATSTITITIYGTNDVPVVTNDSASVTEDESDPTLSTSGAVTITDTDQGEGSFDPSTLTFTGRTNNGAGGGADQLGTLTVNADGTYTYDVANSAVQYLGEGDSIVQTFTVTSSDGTATSTITITINGTNDVPVVTDDSASVTEDESDPTLSTSGAVTITDTDQGEGSFDPSTLTFTGRENNGAGGGSSQLGTLVVNADGTYTYEVANSAVQYLGEGDSIVQTFTVTSSDGTATSTITITINGTNDVPVVTDDSASVTEDESDPTLSTSGSVTITDTDAGEGSFDTESVQFTGRTNNGVTGGSNLLGSLQVNEDGTYTYEVANSAVQFLGEGDSIVQTFTVKSSDGTATSTITITIYGTNDKPEVTNDSAFVTEDDSDPILSTSGAVTITDTDQGEGSFDPSTLAFTGRENYGVTGPDTQLGTLVVNPDGTYTFEVANSAVQFLGAEDYITQTFTVTSSDGTATSTITITIYGTNDEAVITNDAVSVTEDESNPTLSVSGAVTNTDPDQGEGGASSFNPQTLEFTGRENNGVTGGSGQLGSLVVNADGTYTFEVANSAVQFLGAGDSIVQTFTVETSDGTGTSTITITINGTNDVPVVTDDSASVTEDESNPMLTTGGQVTVDDADQGESTFDTSTLTFTGRTNSTGGGPAGELGSLVVDANGNYTFEVNNGNAQVQGLAEGESIVQTYTIQSFDGTATSTITITINGTNDKPTITTDSGNPQGGHDVVYEAGLPGGSGVGPTTVLAGGTLTLSDTDGLDDLKSVTINGTTILIGDLVGSTVAGDNGTLTITAYDADTGVATYSYELTSPATDGAGTESDTFTLTTSDGHVSSDPASIVIDIVDDVPVALNDADSVTEDGPLVANGNVLTGVGGNDANDTDGVEDTVGADGLGSIAWTGQSGNSVAGSYGTLTVNADGSYSYALNNGLAAVQGLDAGQTLTETFTYTLTDGDGDDRTATLTVTINGTNDKPTIDTNTGNPGGANDVVYEAGLGGGSGVGNTTTTASGTITLGDADGLDDLQSVTINGTTIAINNLVGSSVAGPNGTLQITAYNTNTGVASYTYTLTSPATDGAGTENNTFTVTTSDGTTSSDPADIVIDIVDDVPVARNDVDSVTEDGATIANGNVLTGVGGNDANSTDGVADTAGADGIGAPVWTGASGNTVAGSYGTLTVGADGSYSYVLNNGLAAVQGLDAGQTLTETFTYTITDGDGDARSATLTVTVNGSNDKPTIVTNSGNPGNANDIVYEAGLPAGTGVGPTTVNVGGTFTLADPDGLDDLQSVTINGTTIAINNLVGASVNGPNGTLTITAFNAATGVATYAYALTSAATDVAGTEQNTFTITTSDGTTSSDPAQIVIDIVDDVPLLTVDNLAIANVAGTFSGNLSFDVGADVQTFAQSFNTANALTWTNPRDGFTFNYDTATQTGTATFNGGTQTFFTVKLNADGTYDFNLVTPDPVTVVDVGSLLQGISGGSGLANYAIASSNFGGEFALVLTGFQNNGATASTLTISSTELGVGDNVMHGNKDDLLRFDVQPVGGSDATVTSMTIHVASTAGWKAGDTASMTVHYTDGTTGTVTTAWGSDQQITFNFDPSKTVDYLDLTPVGDNSFKIDGVSMSYTKPSFPDDYQLNFNLTGDDADGDTVTDGFSVNVNTTETSTYTVTGTSGADTLHGTSGNDTLVGAGGSDTFAWALADRGTPGSPAVDKITDFQTGSVGAGGDVLDLRDLLVGEANNAGSLDNYLHFTQAGGTTTVSISTTGGFAGGFNAAAVDQQIQLQGVDLTAGGTLNDQQIIQNLLNNGNLHQ